MYIPVLRDHDAASNDALQMAHWLQSDGYKTALEAREIHKKESNLFVNLSDLRKVALLEKDATLIVHYCGYDRTLRHLLQVLSGPVLVRYHDITPPFLFGIEQWRSILFSVFGQIQMRRLMQNSRIKKIIQLLNGPLTAYQLAVNSLMSYCLLLHYKTSQRRLDLHLKCQNLCYWLVGGLTTKDMVTLLPC